jgi:DNA polymerase I-like protein with 3'-5' exonuclease and polymerase domains
MWRIELLELKKIDTAFMKQPKPVVIDFETHSIEPRPAYPPVPVSVAIKYPGKPAKFYAWGHPTKNNCTKKEALTALKLAWRWQDGILCQNGKFDVDVAMTHLGLPMLPWDKIHDSMFLLFLNDPHQKELSLKPSAELLLGLKPEERDAVGDWLIEHQPVPGVKISRSVNSDHYFGRYIALAPGDIVGPYCVGDVVRTEKLFNLLWPSIAKRGMLPAYDRERELMPTLLDLERQGVPVDLRRLSADIQMYQGWLVKIDSWIHKRIKDKDVNIDSGEQLVKAMVTAGRADPDLLPRTPKTGKYQTNKEALLLGVTDKTLLAMLKYRTQLSTCLNTFMIPWETTAKASGGLIFTTWNQVRSPKGADSVGTRTGRLSSTPNFQNIPKEFMVIWHHEDLRAKLPRCPLALPPLPQVRSYITPFKGDVLLVRDYSQQELRILAHFDGGKLLEQYQRDPWMDMHDFARAELAKMGLYYERKPVKNTNFGLIYGMGVGKLAIKNDMPVDQAAVLKKAVLILYPGLKAMYQEMKRRSKAHEPIRTWGGREYYCEEPQIVNGRIQEYDYKMVNVLIQGSAADCTKEAMIRFARELRRLKKWGVWRVLLTVHDELVVSVPRREYKTAMDVLRQCIESIEFDVKMLSEGSTSTTNWGSLKAYDVKGKIAA